MGTRVATVAILNSNDDLVQIIRDVLHDEGYLTITAHIKDLRDGGIDIVEYMKQRDPDVIIYDIAPPYPLAWRFLELLRSLPTMDRRGFVLTTVNKSAAEKALGKTGFLEVIGGERDLRAVVGEVKKQHNTRKR